MNKGWLIINISILIIASILLVIAWNSAKIISSGPIPWQVSWTHGWTAIILFPVGLILMIQSFFRILEDYSEGRAG